MIARPPLPARAVAPLLQAGVALAIFLVVALFPPAQGDMLLLPLSSRVPLQRVVVESGVQVLGIGAYGGVVVRGERAALASRLLRHGVVPLAASPVLCGEEVA